LGACAAEPPRTIAVTGDQDIGRDAVQGWSGLGFVFSDDPGAADLTIDVRIEAFVSPDCDCQVFGHAEGSTVWIDPSLAGDHRRHTARHEFGHILLEANHLEAYGYTGQPWAHGSGIMNAHPTTWPVEPTADDLALACYTIGVCRTISE
jgi:predicted Zn-dependent protease